MKTIKLVDWIAHKFMTEELNNPKRVQQLYNHYHRMRIWEAQQENTGRRHCPERS